MLYLWKVYFVIISHNLEMLLPYCPAVQNRCKCPQIKTGSLYFILIDVLFQIQQWTVMATTVTVQLLMDITTL